MTSFTRTAAALILTAGIFTGTQAMAAEMTKEQVETIVQEYIMAHPDVIMKSVDDFQRKGMASRQADALKQNKDDLFKNERSPIIGKADGDVVIVEFFDYNCGYCKHAFTDLKALIDSDKNVKVIFKDFPILGPTSETAAKWALAAQKQDKYFAYHQKLMEHQGAITDDLLKQIAKDVGLDVAKAEKDAGSDEIKAQIDKNRSLAGQLSLNGTPAFIIGDEVVPGAMNKEALAAKVAEARKAKAAAPAKKEDAPKKK